MDGVEETNVNSHLFYKSVITQTTCEMRKTVSGCDKLNGHFENIIAGF